MRPVNAKNKYEEATERLSMPAAEASPYIAKVRRRHPRAYLPWESHEDLFLARLVEDGLALDTISDLLKRQQAAIKSRIKKLKLSSTPTDYQFEVATKDHRKALGVDLKAVLHEMELDLDSTQRYISEQKDGTHCVLAGPGSGKTLTLVGRIVYLLNEGVRPDEIALISHTRAAGQELRSRLGRKVVKKLGHVGTYHSLASKILRSLGEKMTRRENDFDQLLDRATKILSQRGTLFRFRHIVVDEFQDTSDLQLDLLWGLSEGVESLMVVGDPNQAIFEWANVTADRFERFIKRHPNCQQHFLSTSYRCRGEVLDIAEDYMSYPMALSPANPGGEAEVTYYKKLEDAVELVSDATNSPTFDTEETAVLTRYGFQAQEIKTSIHGLDIMTIHKAKGKEWPFVIVVYDDTYSKPEGGLEEQRVLFVASTRASQKLLLLVKER